MLEQINLQQLTNIIDESNLTDTKEHTGMMAHVLEHSAMGKIVTVQGCSAGAFLIKPQCEAA